MEDSAENVSSYEEISLTEIFGVLWEGRKRIIVITAIFAFVSVLYALSLPNQYRVTALLAPAQADSSGLSGTLNQLGGLASLAGVNIDSGDTSESRIAQEIMKSWSFIDGFISENNIALEVYATEDWNQVTNELKIDDDLYDVESNKWLLENENTGELGPPSSWSLFLAFSERLAVTEDKKSGLVSVSIEYYSPQIAKQWLDMYVDAINLYMQHRQVEKVSNNIKYLQIQIDKASSAEMKEIFYKIIEEQLKNKMIAEASLDYAFIEVTPSMIPEQKSKPQRSLICILGTLLGGMVSMFLVLVMHYGKKSNSI